MERSADPAIAAALRLSRAARRRRVVNVAVARLVDLVLLVPAAAAFLAAAHFAPLAAVVTAPLLIAVVAAIASGVHRPWPQPAKLSLSARDEVLAVATLDATSFERLALASCADRSDLVLERALRDAGRPDLADELLSISCWSGAVAWSPGERALVRGVVHDDAQWSRWCQMVPSQALGLDTRRVTPLTLGVVTDLGVFDVPGAFDVFCVLRRVHPGGVAAAAELAIEAARSCAAEPGSVDVLVTLIADGTLDDLDDSIELARLVATHGDPLDVAAVIDTVG